jgi:hypothetical protein
MKVKAEIYSFEIAHSVKKCGFLNSEVPIKIDGTTHNS